MNDKKIIDSMNDLERRTWGNHYFLNEDHTYRICTLMEWGDQLQTINKHVAHEVINGCRISTVWLGTNHNWREGPPLLFETMVFKEGYSEIYCDRYTTWAEAEAGHQKAIDWVNNGCKEDTE